MGSMLLSLVEKVQRGSERALDEANFNDVLRRNRNIDQQFPTFDDRVDAVARKGGTRMLTQKPGVWKFKVHSGTKSTTWYENYVHWKNIVDVIKDKCADRRLWKADKSGVDRSKLAREVFYNTDIEIFCICPAALYWGAAYTLTQMGAKYTEPENRRPRVRNPQQKGCLCKHAAQLFEVLPAYIGTMAAYLRKFYSKDMQQAEAAAKREVAGVKKAADYLKGREGTPRDEESPEEEEK